jgi:hypothetical protein
LAGKNVITKENQKSETSITESENTRRVKTEDAILCQDCLAQETETQSHSIVCPRWDRIRSGLELSKIEDMVVFLQKLLAKRMAHREPHKSLVIETD